MFFDALSLRVNLPPACACLCVSLEIGSHLFKFLSFLGDCPIHNTWFWCILAIKSIVCQSSKPSIPLCVFVSVAIEMFWLWRNLSWSVFCCLFWHGCEKKMICRKKSLSCVSFSFFCINNVINVSGIHIHRKTERETYKNTHFTTHLALFNNW